MRYYLLSFESPFFNEFSDLIFHIVFGAFNVIFIHSIIYFFVYVLFYFNGNEESSSVNVWPIKFLHFSTTIEIFMRFYCRE